MTKRKSASDFYRWFTDPSTPTEAEVVAQMERDTRRRGKAARQAAIADWRQRYPEAPCSDATVWALIQLARAVGKDA